MDKEFNIGVDDGLNPLLISNFAKYFIRNRNKIKLLIVKHVEEINIQNKCRLTMKI